MSGPRPIPRLNEHFNLNFVYAAQAGGNSVTSSSVHKFYVGLPPLRRSCVLNCLHMTTPIRPDQMTSIRLDGIATLISTVEKPVNAVNTPPATVPMLPAMPSQPSQLGYLVLMITAMATGRTADPNKIAVELAVPISIAVRQARPDNLIAFDLSRRSPMHRP
jgi:hypothetical protein